MTEQRLEREVWMNSSPRVVRYEILTSYQTLEGVEHLTYGIQCMGDWKGQWHPIDSIADISVQRANVVRLTEQFNRLQLSPVHFREVVLDCVNA